MVFDIPERLLERMRENPQQVRDLIAALREYPPGSFHAYAEQLENELRKQLRDKAKFRQRRIRQIW